MREAKKKKGKKCIVPHLKLTSVNFENEPIVSDRFIFISSIYIWTIESIVTILGSTDPEIQQEKKKWQWSNIYGFLRILCN